MMMTKKVVMSFMYLHVLCFFQEIFIIGVYRYREFIVYDRHQCYPEFVVEYERVNK
jgi:hypothetical protein